MIRNINPIVMKIRATLGFLTLILFPTIVDAPEPWGPWTVVYYQNNWGEGHFPVNTFYWNFSNKWTSEDGKAFSLIFTGRKENDSFNLIRGKFILK